MTTARGSARPAAPRIRVGISACLLGQEVRYDGGHRRDHYITDTLGRFFEWVPVCPEVELGLGVPRETLRLEDDLCGYILKKDSPSCGMERVRVQGPRGGPPARRGVGLFARALLERFPDLPVEEEERLCDLARRENFIERVFAYRRRRGTR